MELKNILYVPEVVYIFLYLSKQNYATPYPSNHSNNLSSVHTLLSLCFGKKTIEQWQKPQSHESLLKSELYCHYDVHHRVTREGKKRHS